MTRYDGLTDCPWCADDPSGACTDCRVALDAEEAAERAEDARWREWDPACPPSDGRPIDPGCCKACEMGVMRGFALGGSSE